ncbi:MAG TPA: hypothetical protein VFB01_04150 [Burkholderiales bacterium]|nr:hypothetical protein [Burkholderiales bacterium]
MSATDSVLNSWWLLPVLWIGLSVLATAALSTARREPAPEPEPEPTVDEPVAPPPFLFDSPDASSETIGWYMGVPIHRSARFDGIDYEFDRICPPQSLRRAVGERVVAPGIVYVRRPARGAF